MLTLCPLFGFVLTLIDVEYLVAPELAAGLRGLGNSYVEYCGPTIVKNTYDQVAHFTTLIYKQRAPVS